MYELIDDVCEWQQEQQRFDDLLNRGEFAMMNTVVVKNAPSQSCSQFNKFSIVN